MTLFIRVTVYKSRVSVASSRPLPLGLVGETRTTATAVRACTSATVPVTLSIYDYLLHGADRTGAEDSAYLVSPISYGRTTQSASKKGDVKVE
jgi:hypothetical protein